MKKKIFIINTALILGLVLLLNTTKAQTNLGLSAVSTHSGGGSSTAGYGAELYNDGNIPLPWDVAGTYLWGWVTSNGWIEFTWASAQTFNRVIFHKANRPFTTCTFQYWDGSTYVNFYNYSSSVIDDTVDLTASVTTTRLRFNACSGSNNPNFREIQVYQTKVWNVDAGVASILSPTTSVSPGTHNVIASLRNYGKTTMTSVTLGWSINGVNQTPVSWTGTLSPNQSVAVTLANYSFTLGFHDLKVWTQNPNNMLDSNKLNDTIKSRVLGCNLLSGNYIIDHAGNGDFKTFNEAISALLSCGINSPVHFTVRPGTYNERVVIPKITGTSATNTITFDGIANDRVKLAFSNTTTAERAVLALQGAQYMIFKNITIENTNATYAHGIHLSSQANYNRIENCIIKVPDNSTSTNFIAILASTNESSYTGYSNTANYNLFLNNTVIGGYYGFKLNGTSSSSHCVGNQIIGNTITSQYYYGMHLYYQKNVIARYNKIINPRYNYHYGIYSYYTLASIYDGNLIHSGAYGMYIYYNQNTLPDTTLVINNMITNFTNKTYQYGIYLYYSHNIKVYHNSIWIDGIYSTKTYGGIRNYYSNNNVIKNNIIKSTGDLPCYVQDGTTTVSPGAIDFNNYITGSTASVYYNGSTHKTLTDYQKIVPDQNMNSISIEPDFIAQNNLHLKSSAPSMIGTELGILKDFDGDARCDLETTMGADEFPFIMINPVAGFVSDDSICINSSLYCQNIASKTEVKIHEWYVNGIFKSSQVDFFFKPDNIGFDTIRLFTRNCFGSDTFTKVIQVVNPSAIPVSEFSTDKNTAQVDESINLLDLSKYCPSGWNWKIIPDSIYDISQVAYLPTFQFINGTNSGSQNPSISFNYSGQYEICLNTSNTIGNGNAECKPNYIKVISSAKLCYSDTESEDATGFLYDNGGENNPYSGNKKCTYYIHPCASSVSLSFSQFDLKEGDYLRIYDGKNEYGTPLWDTILYPKGLGGNITASFPTLSKVITAQSGKMYIEFETDNSIEGDGFAAYWTSVEGVFSPPTASFNIQDSVCNGSIVFFENTSIGVDNKYYWDFNNDEIMDAFTMNPYHTFTVDGAYHVKLIASNCGGSDTFVKTVYVYLSTAKPTFEIIADNYTPIVNTDVVRIEEHTLSNCVDTFSWNISPNSYKIKSGNLHTNYLDVVFEEKECYTVTLISGYKNNLDTVTKKCMIYPVEYCEPKFSTVSPDIGISRVIFKDIDNRSTAGIVSYQDFTSLDPEIVEIGASYSISIYRNTKYNSIQRKVWIDLNKDSKFDSSEVVAYDKGSNTLSWTGIITIPFSSNVGQTVMRVAVATEHAILSPCDLSSYAEYEDYPVIISIPVTPPIITLYGNPVIHIKQCDFAYTDAGAFATAFNGSILTNLVITNNLDPSTPGTYHFTYNVTDNYGNLANEVKRTIIVDAEKVAPVITLNGNLHDTLVVHNVYNDPLYIAYDTCSGLDTVVISGNLDIHRLGHYTINYKAIDHNGNFKQISRFVHVIDNIAPEITTFDSDTILLDVNTTLNPRVLKITDNYYKHFIINTSGTFYDNFNSGYASKLGYFTLIYEVVDGSLNKSSISFVVEVVDTKNPEIFLEGSRIYNLCRYDTLQEEGYSVIDNFDTNPTVTVTGSYFDDYLVNFGNGYFEIQYQATDQSGNTASMSRYIFVTDVGKCASSIGDEKAENNILVYPNPSTGIFYVSFKDQSQKDYQLRITDVLGKEVKVINQLNEPLIKVDLSSYQSGIYFFRINTDDSRIVIPVNLVR